MTKFIDVLVRLPNLRTLELLCISHRSPVTRGLKRKCATFPNIREMIICSGFPDFIRSCPNLESLTLRRGSQEDYDALGSYGAELKRVGGVDISNCDVDCELPNAPSDPRQSPNRPGLQMLCGAARNFEKSHFLVISGYVPLPLTMLKNHLCPPPQ